MFPALEHKRSGAWQHAFGAYRDPSHAVRIAYLMGASALDRDRLIDDAAIVFGADVDCVDRRRVPPRPRGAVRAWRA
eukprot:2565971-Rhodomonas_salina.2